MRSIMHCCWRGVGSSVYASADSISIMSAEREPQLIECGWKVIIDVVLLVIVAVPILVLKLWVDPFRRGFYCDDESIAHPHKSDTVPLVAVVCVSIALFFICVPLIELVVYRRGRNSLTISGDAKTDMEFSVFGHLMPPYLVAVYQAVGAVCFGAALCQLTTDITKYSLGRLRPHFLDVCMPDWGAMSCKDVHGLMVYIQDDVCTQTDAGLLKEARLSFPSGHASFSLYAMVYMILFLQVKMTWRHGPSLLKHFLQALLVYMAVYTCLSRVSDYKHHWSDVLGGSLIGATVGLLTARYISNMFDMHKLQDLTRLLQDLKLLNVTPSRALHQDVQLQNV